MKKVFYILIPVVLVAIVALRLKSNKEITQDKIYRYDKEQPISIQADTLEQTVVAGEYFYAGSFEPNRESKISAEIQGKVNELFVDAGSFVKKGQTLLQLDNTLLKLQLQSIDVQIDGLHADVNRYTILTQADAIQGVQLEKAQLGLKAAHVQRNTLLEQINKTAVKAPFSGVVTAKLTEIGAFAAPGVPLLQITDISDLKFTINVPESDLNTFDSKGSGSIVPDAYPDLKLTGEIVMIGSKGNAGNSFPIQLKVRNTADLKIKSGMFGKLILKGKETKKEIVIPASAITGSAVQPQVYVIENGKAMLRDITVAKRFENKVVVTSGLRDGDIIASGGFINLFHGANVVVEK